MRRLADRLVALSLLSASLLFAMTGPAAAGDPPTCVICVGGGDDGRGFGGGGSNGGAGQGGGSGSPGAGGGAGPVPPDVVEQTSYVPTCAGNTPENSSGLCGAATTTCPTPGDMRFWVYTRQYNRVTQTALTAWTRTNPPGFVCLGPDAPGIDPIIAVVATVRRDFKQFPIEKATVRTRPDGQSLVNADTEVSTTADGTDVIRQTILGLPVVVTAIAQSYTWRFGDGTAQTVRAEGHPMPVRHKYARPGSYQLSLDVTYGGTFTVGTSPVVYDVQGTATITGPPAALDVREARSQLEGGSSTGHS